MKKLFILVLISFSSFSQNLVLNPSFEESKKCDEIKESFNDDVFEWNSPTYSSPDLFSECKTRLSDYHKTLPNSGKNCSGIAMFNSTMDYSEYIQGKFSEQLIAGKEYRISFYVKLNEKSTVALNQISFLLLDQKLSFNNSYVLNEKRLKSVGVNEQSIFHIKSDVFFDINDWVMISTYVKARGGEEYIVIGNFKDVENIEIKSVSEINMFKLSYYFIDDVSIKKVGEELTLSKVDEFLVEEAIEADTEYTFKSIVFKSGSSKLINISEKEIDKILSYLSENPNSVIEIRGHTDNIGSKAMNLELSIDRAKAIADYLVKNGVKSTNTIIKGFGDTKPIATNETKEGRSLNRRVNFIIIN